MCRYDGRKPPRLFVSDLRRGDGPCGQRRSPIRLGPAAPGPPRARPGRPRHLERLRADSEL